MEDDRGLLVYGSEHRERGEVRIFEPPPPGAPPAALAITPGLLKSINEDAGGWSRRQGFSCYAVADAHFGAAASQVAVRLALDLIGGAAGASGAPTLRSFRDTLLECAVAIERTLAGGDKPTTSETALLVVASVPGRVLWGSVGDARLYAGGAGSFREITSPRSEYLGPSARAREALEPLVQTGLLTAGDLGSGAPRLLLTTDGIPESRGTGGDDWSPGPIGALISPPLAVRAALGGLVEQALTRGGADNVCAILFEAESGG